MDKKLLSILVCPICKGKVQYRAAQSDITCSPCRLAFPVQDDIPVMLESEAKPLDGKKS